MMPAKSSVVRAGWVARLVSVFLVAGCVGEIGESAPGPNGGSGGSGSTGNTTMPTGIGGRNDSTGTGAGGVAGTGSDSSGAGGAGASAGDGGGATGGSGGNDVTGSGGIAGAGATGGSGTGGSGASGRGGGAGSGSGGTTGAGGDPFTVAPKCTSGTMWTQANRGSTEMNPGKACITCHSTMNGPSLTIAGTVYPTAHEPDLCNGAPGSNGARIVITGADGVAQTLTPGTSGN